MARAGDNLGHMTPLICENLAMADYRIGRDGTVVEILSERATKRASGSVHPKVGTREAFRTKYDTAQFVRAGEAEGFTFEGKSS
jgi:hypothetical protein